MKSLVRSELQNYTPADNITEHEIMTHVKARCPDVYHFGFSQSPFPLMEEAVHGLTKHAAKNEHLPISGLKELRQAICDFHKLHDDVSFCPDDVVVGPGSKALIYLTLSVFDGDVIVISPSWTTYKTQLLLTQHTPRIMDTSLAEDWKISAASLTKFLEENQLSHYKLLILKNPCTPTGTSYTSEELKAMADVCRRHNVIVLADESYARLKFNHDHVSMLKMYPEGTLLCSSLSKWASASGWRVGYQIYARPLFSIRGAIRGSLSHIFTSVAAPIQYAACEFLQNEAACTAYQKHTTRIMAAVAKYCHRELTSVGVKVLEPTAGFYIFPNFNVIKKGLGIRKIRTCQQMVDHLCIDTSITVMPLDPARNELTVRLCYVDFDGGLALKESRKIGLETQLPDTFVKDFCTYVYDGIQLMKGWVEKEIKRGKKRRRKSSKTARKRSRRS